ncbi:MAG: tyrosine-type recombinase/integrase, partial [Desulfosalsimonas sp.]
MKSKSKLKRVAPDRWPGVYSRELQTRHQGKPDISYYITYKDHAARKRWEKAGKRSEGYTPQIASEIRTERLRTARHGGEVKTAREIQVEKYKKDRTLQTIADAYFDSEHGMKLKGRKTDKNRWELHLKPLIGKRRVSSLTVLDVQHLKKSMEKKAPATIWNTLELLRRICNYGRKINYCPPLSFTIEMPKRKNAREEFLSPEEAQRLIGVLEAWKRQDVARMLKLAMFTGMRRGEIFKLQDDDIDWLHERIILQASGNMTPQRVS